MKFKTGSVVKLRSGGPPMTVYAHDDQGITVCWFERKRGLFDSFSAGNEQLEQRRLPAAMLELVSEPAITEEGEPIQ